MYTTVEEIDATIEALHQWFAEYDINCNKARRRKQDDLLCQLDAQAELYAAEINSLSGQKEQIEETEVL